jgi:hypothetical protein
MFPEFEMLRSDSPCCNLPTLKPSPSPNLKRPYNPTSDSQRTHVNPSNKHGAAHRSGPRTDSHANHRISSQNRDCDRRRRLQASTPLSGLTSQTHPYWGEYIPRSFRRPCCQTQFAIYTRRSKYIDALLLRRQGRVSEKLLGRMLVGD